MRNEPTFERAVELASHYLAIGMTEIYLFRDAEIPQQLYQLVTGVEASGSFRLDGPAGVRFEAKHPCGLTFAWSVDFEPADANGTGTHKFDRDRLRGVAYKLNPEARVAFASFLERAVLPPLKKRTEEIRAALNKQTDSYDCLLGLIAFAKDQADA